MSCDYLDVLGWEKKNSKDRKIEWYYNNLLVLFVPPVC